MNLGLAIEVVAPIYNLGLVAIAIWLFIKLFSTPVKNRQVYLMPWKILFVAVTVFIIEEVITVLRSLEIINIPAHINGFFELIIICSFIYMILLQKEKLKTRPVSKRTAPRRKSRR